MADCMEKGDPCRPSSLHKPISGSHNVCLLQVLDGAQPKEVGLSICILTGAVSALLKQLQAAQRLQPFLRFAGQRSADLLRTAAYCSSLLSGAS